MGMIVDKLVNNWKVLKDQSMLQAKLVLLNNLLLQSLKANLKK